MSLEVNDTFRKNPYCGMPQMEKNSYETQNFLEKIQISRCDLKFDDSNLYITETNDKKATHCNKYTKNLLRNRATEGTSVAVHEPVQKLEIKADTKSKLIGLEKKFDGFEKRLEVEAKHRKDLEEEKMAVIREAVHKLERSINAEVKRRVDATNSLHQMFETHLGSTKQKLEGAFIDKLDHLTTAVEELHIRMGQIDRTLGAEREGLKHKMDQQHRTINQTMSIMQELMDTGKSQRAEREAQITNRMLEIENRIKQKFEANREARQQRHEKLSEEIEEAKLMRSRTDAKFQECTMEEISRIKNALLSESQAREAADDEIVQAVNRYTQTLQDALRLINSG